MSPYKTTVKSFYIFQIRPLEFVVKLDAHLDITFIHVLEEVLDTILILNFVKHNETHTYTQLRKDFEYISYNRTYKY